MRHIKKGNFAPNMSFAKQLSKLAKAGSPAAEPLADKYILEQIAKE